MQVEEARLTLQYGNGTSLALAAEVELLDASDQPVSVRIPAEGVLQMMAAPVNAQGFGTTYREGEVSVVLDRMQLEQLKQGRRARLILQLQTLADRVSAVRIRASNALRLWYRIRVH